MKKRLVSLLLVMWMIVGMLPVNAFEVEFADTIYVGGVELSDGQYLAVDAEEATTIQPEVGYAHYAGGVLTLHNYTFEGEGYKYDGSYSAVVYAGAGLKVVLEGENSLDNTIPGEGIFASGNITVDGAGSLKISAEIGISAAGSITIEDFRTE